MRSVSPVDALTVSLHDVSPLTSAQSARILDDLEAVGVRAVSLLVIPDHHGKAPADGDPGFRSWLGERAGGREVVLHGYSHRREPHGKEGRVARAVTGIYTAGEGEFFDLEEEEALSRLDRGRAALAGLGFPEPAGFVAPAWLLGPDAARAVWRSGFLYTTRLGGVEWEGGRSGHRSQSLVWSVRAPWRRIVSLAWNAGLGLSLRSNQLVRVGIHPPDWDFPAIRGQILRQIGSMLARREAMTYEAFVRSALT